MKKHIIPAALISLSVLTSACAVTSARPKHPRSFGNDAADAVAQFKKRKPQTKRHFAQAYGYAIFPTVGKGGAVVGVAYGRGLVFERGRLVGTTTLTQITVGAHFGGEAYREVVFFEDRAALERFKTSRLEVGARASAVAAAAGAAADSGYAEGVAIFTLTKGGLMYEASVGGQKFIFEPLVAQK